MSFNRKRSHLSKYLHLGLPSFLGEEMEDYHRHKEIYGKFKKSNSKFFFFYVAQ